MAENSAIEWTDHTQNFWIGCQEVSAACDHCYAREQNKFRKWVDGWGPHGERKRSRVEETERDWIACPITLRRGFTGAKPRKVCRWIFRLIGARPGDEFHDLFPGSGAVQAAWDDFSRKPPQLEMSA